MLGLGYEVEGSGLVVLALLPWQRGEEVASCNNKGHRSCPLTCKSEARNPLHHLSPRNLLKIPQALNPLTLPRNNLGFGEIIAVKV